MGFGNVLNSTSFENVKKVFGVAGTAIFRSISKNVEKTVSETTPTDSPHPVPHPVPHGPPTLPHHWGGKGKEGLRHSYDASFRHAIAKRSKAKCKAKRSELQTPLTRRTGWRISVFFIGNVDSAASVVVVSVEVSLMIQYLFCCFFPFWWCHVTC